MTLKQCIFGSLGALVLGTLLYAYSQGWIVIAYPTHGSSFLQGDASTSTHKKTVRLCFWRNERWESETTTLLWPHNKATALYYLVNQWLTTLDDEEMLDKKITLQAALLSPSEKELYLSFDRNPFNAQHATHAKLLFIEGLLRTIAENCSDIQSVRLLVHHQPLIDDHLDFSHAWPVSGFMH